MYSAMRLKKRYAVFQVKSDANLSEREVNEGISAFFLRFFGEYGHSKLSFRLLQYDDEKKLGILRCERGALKEVLGALALIDSLGQKKARAVSLASSGTIKSLREKGFDFIDEKEEK